MYQIVTIEDTIAVTPDKFGSDISKSISESIESKFEGI